MTERSNIDLATRRLAAALDGLEAALERRSEVDRREASLTAQVANLGVDRSRLAAELDQQAARAHRLEHASQEVSRRLGVALEAVRDVVDAE